MKGAMEYRRLPGGARIPAIGFGTADLQGDAARLVESAIRAGHRLIDTAQAYGSEEAVGAAVRRLTDSGEIRREELFLQTKLLPEPGAYHRAAEAFEESLERLQTDYVDLFLLHWPVPRGMEETYREENLEVWQVLEDLHRRGKARGIGVCNFLERHLLQLAGPGRTPPQVNQLEVHPRFQQRGLVRFCRERGMMIEAWSPLGRGALETPPFQKMARDYGKNTGQLALRWGVENGWIPLTRSSNPERIAQNLDVFDFELSAGDREALDGLNTCEGHLDIWSYRRQQMY